MLTCGHDSEPFGAPMCVHLRKSQSECLSYFKWYTGKGLSTELLCKECVESRERSEQVSTEMVCQACFEGSISDRGDLLGVRGRGEVRVRREPMQDHLRISRLPSELGAIVDIAPVTQGHAIWLLLAEDGSISEFDPDRGAWHRIARVNLISEPDHKPWAGHTLQRRLHASAAGEIAAVVNDYGRYGQIVDLRSDRVTMELDGGDYYSTTVPFSFAFATIQGRPVAVHRTAWNRLDISDPQTGTLLTAREPTSYRTGEQRPAHYLDYFHGALQVSPNGVHIVDDGWVWHPVGIPHAWNLQRWLHENVWESEDGPTLSVLCDRAYYWGHAMTWLDDQRLAIGGIGEDDIAMLDGARIFDVCECAEERGRWRWARELLVFPGPAGQFFSDRKSLFSSDASGLSRWDFTDGSRTGELPGFRPTHHHRAAGELVQLVEGNLVRWKIG